MKEANSDCDKCGGSGEIWMWQSSRYCDCRKEDDGTWSKKKTLTEQLKGCVVDDVYEGRENGCEINEIKIHFSNGLFLKICQGCRYGDDPPSLEAIVEKIPKG